MPNLCQPPMETDTIPSPSESRPEFSSHSVDRKSNPARRFGSYLLAACSALALASPADAQEPETQTPLAPGSEVSLPAVLDADWIQGKGPAAFEEGHIYIFECWATWCPPCIGLIPHMNELHKDYYDQGLRVYGMNCWEDERDDVEAFIKAKGAEMSYPVAFTSGSRFESEWLTSAGVEAIPFAFVVRDGKLLLGTEGSRLTNSLIETILSGEEGAQRAAAMVQAAREAREQTESIQQQLYSAYRAKNAEAMAAGIKELEALDPGHPELPILRLKLLITREEWATAVATLEAMPKSYSKRSFALSAGMRIAQSNEGDYPVEFIQAVLAPYADRIAEGSSSIGPNHFAYLSILSWRVGDKQAAILYADKGIEVAIRFSRASEARTSAFKRFARSVKAGTMPAFSELSSWQIEAKKKTAEVEDKPSGTQR